MFLQRAKFGVRDTEKRAEVHVVPAGKLQRFHLIGFHAGHRAPGKQPGVGVRLLRPGRRLIGVGWGNRPPATALHPGQPVQPGLKQFRIFGPHRLRVRDDQSVPQRNEGKIPIPEHKPAITEKPLRVSVKQPRGIIRGVIHEQKLEQLLVFG
jgi:hypothetical protein